MSYWKKRSPCPSVLRPSGIYEITVFVAKESRDGARDSEHSLADLLKELRDETRALVREEVAYETGIFEEVSRATRNGAQPGRRSIGSVR